MEDNKTEDNNKYKVLSSFLDNNPVFSDGNAFPSDEESQKLIFLWDKCNPPAEDVDSVWDKTQQKIKDEVLVAKKRPVFMSAWIWMAASVALLMGLAYFFYHYQGGITEDEKTKMEQLMLAETSTDDVKEVTLVVSDKKKIQIANNSQVAYTKAGQVHVNSTKLEEAATAKERIAENNKEVAEEYDRIIVPKGRRSMIVLADNSRIWINSGSKVIYPRSFKGKKRQIFVEGEVYLKVTHNEAKPFIVNTSTFEVEVLGTSFNVTAYKDRPEASVVLVEGAVDVKDRIDRHIKMLPDERVELNRAGISKKEQVNALDYIHWVDGVWVLQGKPLNEVIGYLTEYYGQSIYCAPSIKDVPFYGKLFLNEELDKVLESIRQTLPMSFTTQKNVIYIEEKP